MFERLTPPTGPLTLERQQIQIRNLPLRLRGLRIIQLSDFHFDGIGLSETLLAQAIARANAQSPDLICLTGDYVTADPSPIHRLAPSLANLRSTYGTYAVLGNHDLAHRGSRQTITKALTQAGIRVLWNEVAYPFGQGPGGLEDFALIGLADVYSRSFRPAITLAEVQEHIPRLVLSHNPDTAETLQRWRVDLQLSGHSHGGQICLPNGIPVLGLLASLIDASPSPVQRSMAEMRSFTHVIRHWEWAAGLHRVGSNWLYVNRGLGTYPPGRLFCPPEISLLTLTGETP